MELRFSMSLPRQKGTQCSYYLVLTREPKKGKKGYGFGSRGIACVRRPLSETPEGSLKLGSGLGFRVAAFANP